MQDIEAQTDLAGVCRGDRAAWVAFVTVTAPLLRGMLAKMLARHAAHDAIPDVLQEVYLRLCRDRFALLHRHDSRRACLSTWLGVIASSVAVDWLRQRSRSVSGSGEALKGLVDPASVHAGLRLPPNLLTPRQTLILRLRYEFDFDVAEIARRLGIHEQTVRSTHHKAMLRLRAALAAEDLDT